MLDEEHSIHDVAALLKEFLRDMPDPLLTRELYTPFINTLCEQWQPSLFLLFHQQKFTPSVGILRCLYHSLLFPISPMCLG